MVKYNHCMNCGTKPHLIFEGDEKQRKNGLGWTLICPECGMPSPKRRATKALTIEAWNQYN